jgi:hypothetical protein
MLECIYGLGMQRPAYLKNEKRCYTQNVVYRF